MTTINVDDVIASPEFLSKITVLRRVETINQYGESTTTTASFNITASVQAGGGDLERMADAQLMTDFITVYTRFRVRGPAPGYQADMMLWRGNHYIVKRLNEWDNYGLGYIKATCESVEALDNPA